MANQYSTAVYRYTNSHIIGELQRVARKLNTAVLSGPAYSKHGSIARFTIATRFGTWRAAVAAAGLKSPTIKGGLRVVCVVCGAMFSGDHGKKARKTCSDACFRKLSISCRTNRKGDAATRQAARGRGRAVLRPSKCARCGHDGSEHRIEAHHIDRDPYNNSADNLEALCVLCHKREHGIKPAPCQWCGAVFKPRRKAQRSCSKRCGRLLVLEVAKCS